MVLNSRSSIKNVDWDFSDATNSSGGIHNIHPYPAKFIPQIPKNLIELLYPGDRSIVLDPFCDSGTTLVEAISQGIDAFGIDLHPLACLIAKVKSTPIENGFVSNITDLICTARQNLQTDNYQIPQIPNLDHWFTVEAQKALTVLIAEIEKQENVEIRDALKVALSSIVVQVSNQDSDTRYAAIEKRITIDIVISKFEKSASALSKILNNFALTYDKLGKATIINRDILMVTDKDLPRKIGLVITSPPYPNAYEYWLYHKYRMYWLGMDPLVVKQREIGARPHYFKKNHQDEKDFERQMSLCFRLLSQVMLRNAKACFLVGRSIIHGREIDNVALLQRAAIPHGFVVEHIIERQIPKTRKAFNPSHGKINSEHLVVFRLDSPQ